MKKLTKEQKTIISNIFDELKRAMNFIQDPEILICRRKVYGPTNTLDFSNSVGETITTIEKEFGSQFVNFYSGVTKLEAILNQH